MISKQEADASFGWVEDLPPTFHGSTTSLPPTATLSHGLPNAGYGLKDGMMQIRQELPPKITSAEVLAAASTLVRNAQNTHSNGLFGGSMFPAPDVDDRIQHVTNDGSSSGAHGLGSYSSMLPALPQQLPSGYSLAKATSAVDSGETLFHDMYFGTSSQVRETLSHAPKAPEIQWGSDVSFLDHGYVAPPNQETEEQVTKTLMHKMECFEPQGSANTTRPSSPVTHRRREQPKEMASDDGLAGNGDISNGEGGELEPRARKRRKNQHKHGGYGGGDTDHGKAGLKHSAAATNGKRGRERRSAASDSLSKRRKSDSAEPKSNRENLTEEQKRSNHILSEQKRRNLIKQGFDDLCTLVPELKGGGFSKSAMLIQAADWIEDVISGNELLKAQLVGLERRRTA